MAIETRKVGRPGRTPESGERVGLSLRVTPAIKKAIEQAAEAQGRSLSQEAELRLEQTFRDEGLLPVILDLAYGRETAGILILLAETIKRTGGASAFAAQSDEVHSVDDAARRIDPEWFETPWAVQQVKVALFTILEQLQPLGTDDAETPPAVLAMPQEIKAMSADLGRYWASLFLNALLAGKDSNARAVDLLAPVRERLPMAIERLRSKQ